MDRKFCSEESEILYKRIVSLNKELMEDESSISLKKHSIINESTLVNICNLVYGYKPFTNPPEAYCEDFGEMTARIIYHLNTGHCFSDGNKRTTLLIIMELIKESYPIYYNEFFRGSLSNFLIEMLQKRLTYEEILEWVYNQYELKYDEIDEEKSLLRIAKNLKNEKLYKEAKEIYRYLMEKFKDSSEAYNEIAEILIKEEDYEIAVEYLEKAINISEEKNIINYKAIYCKKEIENKLK